MADVDYTPPDANVGVNNVPRDLLGLWQVVERRLTQMLAPITTSISTERQRAMTAEQANASAARDAAAAARIAQQSANAASGSAAAGVSAAARAQQTADGKVSKSGDTMTGLLRLLDGNGAASIKWGPDNSGSAWAVWRDPGRGGQLRVSLIKADGTVNRDILEANPGEDVVHFPPAVVLQNIPLGASGKVRWLIAAADGTVRHYTEENFRLLAAAAATTSSATLKHDIHDADPVGVLDRVNVRSYRWNGDATAGMFPGERVGFIAEELAQVDPRLVTVDGDGQPQGVDFLAVIAALTAEVQALKKRVAGLEAPPPTSKRKGGSS